MQASADDGHLRKIAEFVSTLGNSAVPGASPA
jgi:hypothetical protein